jgi:hypothetical protein
MVGGPVRSTLIVLALLAPVLGTGCAGARIGNVSVSDPDSADLTVRVESHDLFSYQRPNKLVAYYAGYQGTAPVPLRGGPQPEIFDIVISDWAFVPNAPNLPITKMELRYMLGNRVIRKRRVAAPFSSPAPIAESIARHRSGGAGNAPPVDRPQPTENRHVLGGRTTENPDDGYVQLSRDLDRPTIFPYPKMLNCRLSYESGPRYLRLRQTPNALVHLTIDVKSHGDARNTNESTWWQIELLDEEGRPLPFMEKEFVDVGGEMRHTADWRLDGSPVIFKIVSGSTNGDSIKIRFEEQR